MRTFYVLGVDQSTQGTKAVLFNEKGFLIARYDLPHAQIINERGWISHDLSEIYHNVIAACKGVIEKAGISSSDICCMGITNQRETTAAWDKQTGKPLAPAVVWQCNRATEICMDLENNRGLAGEIYKKTGLKLSPYYPAAKMSWLIQNVPEVKEKAQKHTLALGTVDSWLIYKLTHGKSFKTDYSNASRTQLFHLRNLCWDTEICNIFGIPVDALPLVGDSDSVFGKTDLEGFLKEPIPICGVVGDSHGALFGHNCRKEGEIKATYGTGSSVMLNVGTTPVTSSHGLSSSLAWKVKGKVSYVLEGNINYTGAVISWIKDEVGILPSAAQTEDFIKKANPQDQTYLVPAFSGLGAPWWKNDASAMIVGMNRSTGKNELVKAACDCIAYQINDVVEAMRKDTGLAIGTLCVDGGPTRNRYLMQFQSDITDAQIRIPDTEELSVIGAAYMAGISLGVYQEKEIYQRVSYEDYHRKMDEKIRQKKQEGWKKAVRMLLK